MRRYTAEQIRGILLSLVAQGGPDGPEKFLRGELVVVEPVRENNVVDLDADPFCPNGWKAVEHLKAGKFSWNPTKVKLFFGEGQSTSGPVAARDLRRQAAPKRPFNANLLDWLLAHQEHIPEGWKSLPAVFFWGTIYRGASGGLFVRFLHRDAEQWSWDYVGLDSRVLGLVPPALVPAP